MTAMDVRTYTTAEFPAWEDAARRIGADVYFRPGYARAGEKAGDGQAVAFHAHDGAREGIEVLMVRDLQGLAFLAGEATDLRDAASPYAYGGPFFTAAARADAGFVAGFHETLATWCRAQRIVARFVRFHPLLDNHAGADAFSAVCERQATYHLDLTGSDPAGNFREAARRHVRHARAAGLTFDELPAKGGLKAFRGLYEATMRRVGARPYYLFPPDYYEALADGLGAGVKLFAVRREDRIAAAGLFLVGPDYAHYHLGGSDAAFLPDRPNNLLFHGAATALAASGARVLHLGGGLTSGDTLDRFKRSLSRRATRFRTGAQVLDPAAYADLVSRWERWTGAKADPAGFFPAYRAAS
jgi:hypothetical protein